MSNRTVNELVAAWRGENIETFFDLGLFIDRLADAVSHTPAPEFSERAEFDAAIKRGVAFCTYRFGIDGVTMEVVKYAAALREIHPNVALHFVSGLIDTDCKGILPPDGAFHEVAGMDGFDAWPSYVSFFEERLERGGPTYNQLIVDFWAATVDLAEKLGGLAHQQQWGLLYVINTNSNPGNVALSLALAMVSHGLGIPVICNNHDFYWEGGSSVLTREAAGTTAGPRDHFFLNQHLGEVFSLIETLFPWDSPSWLSVNINRDQARELVNTFGFSPASVVEIGTSVDTNVYAAVSAQRAAQATYQIGSLLTGVADGDPARVPLRSLRDALANDSLQPDTLTPMLLGHTAGEVDFVTDNMMLLQPTRIVARKSIGHNTELLAGLAKDPEFQEHFAQHPRQRITLLVTGPIAQGHFGYFKHQLERFASMLEDVPEAMRERIHLGFLFAGFDRQAFKAGLAAKGWTPITMADIYNVASMVVLPSETEGRGLPIIESAACGRPIFVRRYSPEKVYAEVVGEHLHDGMRLRVFDFPGWELSDVLLNQVKRTLLYPQEYEADAAHNRRVAEARYSVAALTQQMEGILNQLYLQLTPRHQARTRAAARLKEYRQTLAQTSPELDHILHRANRQYLCGFGQMSFMNMLKALVDPSFFRVEEQLQRGFAYQFAQELVDAQPQRPAPATLNTFYHAVQSLFSLHEGEMPVRMDHAMSYRHRDRRDYGYRHLTPHELTGVISLLFNELCPSATEAQLNMVGPHLQTDWGSAIGQLCGTTNIPIDHRHELLERLTANVPLAVFPGRSVKLELELFVVQTLRHRLGLAQHQPLTRDHIEAVKDVQPVYVFKRRQGLGTCVSASVVLRHIQEGPNEDLRLLYEMGRCKVIETEQVSVGIDFRQFGKQALATLATVREGGGALISVNRHAAMTTDFANIDRFHIGHIRKNVSGQMMGIPIGAGYIQWVPAGLRFCLGYPVSQQTGLTFSNSLSGERFARLSEQLGQKELLVRLNEDAEAGGSPIEDVLTRLDQRAGQDKPKVEHHSVNGVYEDGLPWAGVLATVQANLSFKMITAPEGTQTVSTFVQAFNREQDQPAQLAWNGGYILNPELVGKLGLPESYIGSPLGLLISNGRVSCPPLFNKPAFMVHKDGRLEITKVDSAAGFVARAAGSEIEFRDYNPEHPGDAPAFYDLLHPNPELDGNGRVLLRMAGSRIIEVIRTKPVETVRQLPVGLTLSLLERDLPEGWRRDTELNIELFGFEHVSHAVEAGPLLLDGGTVAINMEAEGWKTENSIRTQAARLDFTDMRGPKIAVGLDANGRLSVLAINGRIRESVGATHYDMAHILEAQGMVSAMGFDPGGSATLVVGEETVNMSPYNARYLEQIYSAPPEPRPVANAVIGF